MTTMSTMLPRQSPLPWFDAPSNATTASSQSPFTAANAVAESILGFPASEEDNLWGLGPLSPALPTWNAREQIPHNQNARIDLKNTRTPKNQLPRSQPDRMSIDSDTSNTRHQCQLVPSRVHQLDHSPISKRTNARAQPDVHHKRRKSSQASTTSDEPSEENSKREKYLERNRIAATKCRQRKKEQTKRLETRFEEQSDRKDHLVRELGHLRSEALCLKDEVLKHAECGDRSIKRHVSQMADNIPYGHCNSGLMDSMDDDTPSFHFPSGPVTQANLPLGFEDHLHLTESPMAAFE